MFASLRANGSGSAGPMTGSSKQSRGHKERLDCFVARAPRNDGLTTAVILRSRALARRLEGCIRTPALAAHPSRLAQEGEQLRMTAVLVEAGAKSRSRGTSLVFI